ncbi:MAG: hypothetical protein H7061_10465 [Bdellovibrionaceae bacterium]|nr:hypothetical protein [Bdellovibrio sp.]
MFRNFKLAFVGVAFSLFCLTSVAKPVTGIELVPLMKKFKSYNDFFDFVDTVAPKQGLSNWAEWSKKNISAKMNPANLNVQGMKLFVAGIKDPFEFSNDGLTITYKEIAITSQAGLTPKMAMAKVQKAWGHFREFKSAEVTQSKFYSLVISNAQADGISEATAIGSMRNAYYIVPAFAAVGATVGALAGSTFGPVGTIAGAAAGAKAGVFAGLGTSYFLNVFTTAQSMYLLRDPKTNEVMDSKLECPKGIPQLTYDHKDMGFRKSGLSAEENKTMISTLTQICKNPDVVAEFNQALFYFKRQIFNGDAKYFEIAAEARTPQGNPMGDGVGITK